MNVAFIPVRGGSKSIPLKNIKPICGKPLVYWTINAASECKYIDKVYVATDSEAIKSAINSFISEKECFSKVEVISRSAESANDTASTEFAMLEFASKYEFDNIVLIQATSPLLSVNDLNNGFELFNNEETDSVLSAVKQKRFNWQIDDSGYAKPTNYDVFNRPRRQEFDGYYVENGAFYITRKGDLLKYKNRVSGNMKICEMNEDTFFEIDEPSDWLIIEALMKKRGLDCNVNFKNIKLLLTDCDGCLTDGGMYYSENGDELKKFNTRDGMAFKLLRENGVKVGIITGENRKLNEVRANKLKLDYLYQGVQDKLEIVKKICNDNNFTLAEVCYIGDDINDIETIESVGLGCCPNDAVSSVKNKAKYISFLNGGKGIIREIADKILNSK